MYTLLRNNKCIAILLRTIRGGIMAHKIQSLVLFISLAQPIFLNCMGQTYKKEFFSADYLPLELQKHILELSMQSSFQDTSKFDEVLNGASQLLKNVLPVNKSFRSFKNDLILSFLAHGNHYISKEYSALDRDQKNKQLQLALTGKKSSENEHNAIRAILAGADVNLLIATDLTTPRAALGWAVLWPSPTLIKLLLIAGARIDFQNINGYTALMQAVCEGHKEIVKILLEYGADATLTTNDKFKKTAFDMALKKEIIPIIELLSKQG